MFILNSIPSQNWLILLLLSIRFISTLCVGSPKEDAEKVEDKNNSQPLVPTVNEKLNEYIRKNEAGHSNKNDDSSVRAEHASLQSMPLGESSNLAPFESESSHQWLRFDENRQSSNVANSADHTKGVDNGRKLTITQSDKSTSSNSIGIQELNDAYELLVKDWEILPDPKKESNIPKITEEEPSEDDTEHRQTSVINHSSTEPENEIKMEHGETDEKSPKQKQNEEIIQINTTMGDDDSKIYEKNGNLIAQLTPDQSTKNAKNSNEIEQKVNEKATKHGKSQSLMAILADKIKLLRANSQTKMQRSKSADNSSSSSSRNNSFAFDQANTAKNKMVKNYSDSETIVTPKFDHFASASSSKLRRSQSTESFGLKSAEKGFVPKTGKEHLVDALNAALTHQIVRQKQSQYISEWKCASKYWTKYLTHFFWRNEQVAMCKSWARVDAKVSELLDAWKALSELPQRLLMEFLITDKLEVEVGGNPLDVNQIFGHLRSAHQCIFGATNAAEGKKCQNAKILNANEWEKQIKKFKNEAKAAKTHGQQSVRKLSSGP